MKMYARFIDRQLWVNILLFRFNSVLEFFFFYVNQRTEKGNKTFKSLKRQTYDDSKWYKNIVINEFISKLIIVADRFASRESS